MNSEFPCPAHTCTHTRKQAYVGGRKLKPLFTIAVQSDVLEIKRKGEGGEEEGKVTWEGRKKENHVFYLFLLLFCKVFLWIFFSFQPHVVTLTNDDA